jgi:two-component system KDP operon response regulator KdpE
MTHANQDTTASGAPAAHARVLVVDDDPHLLKALRITLAPHGYAVDAAADGAAALVAVSRHAPDLLILDLGLPDMDGVEVLRDLRRWSTMPVLVLSARHGSADKVGALDAGADDYVTKPFSVDELLARVRVATRDRDPSGAPEVVTIGRYTINLADHSIRADGSTSGDGAGHEQDVHLTRTEWQLLEAVVREPGKLVGQRYLLEQVWGPTYRTETQYVRQYMAQLRRKLEDEPARPRHLLTEPGMGYRFQP